MYRYNINKTKLVIIPLDGTILDLNRSRYNYYHHLCDDKHLQLNKQDFYNQLSNMYDMYKTLPLDGKVDTGPLNAKIERELAQYLSYKGIKPKDGIFELIEYLHQKNIKVAVISTHRTKDAVSYLQQIKLYNKVQFIIGSDTNSFPLPSTQILETTVQYFQVNYEDTLVISSFMSLNRAAYKLNMGIIFCEDLMPATSNERETSYKVVSNLFEVLNIFLFDKYEEAEIYSPILGMTDNMSKEQLDQTRHKLEETYKDDSQIMDLVNQTYEYHISQLNVQEPSPINQDIQNKQFSFEDSDSITEDILNTDTEESILEQQDEQNIHPDTLSHKDQEELTALLQQINKKEPQESTIKKVTDYNEIKQIVKEAQPQDEKHHSLLLSFIINVLYIFAISFLILFVGIIVYIAFIHQFETNEGIFAAITHIYNAYYSIIEGFFSIVLNTLHSLISFIPSYQQYETANAWFSIDGIKLFNIFLFHSLLISVIKTIIFIIKRGQKNEEDF